MFKQYVHPLLLVWLLCCAFLQPSFAANETSDQSESIHRTSRLAGTASANKLLAMSEVAKTDQTQILISNSRTDLLDASTVGPLPETIVVVFLSIITLVVTRRQ